MSTGNILFVIDSLRIGGAEKVTLTLAQGFINHGYRVDIIICDNSIEFDIPDNINLHILDFKKSFLDYYRYSKKLHNMVDLIKKNNNIDFDLIIVELQKSVRLMKNYKHKNIYYAIQSNLAQSSIKNRKGLKLFLRKRKLQQIYNNLNIITCSNGIKDDLLEIVNIKPKSIQTIYNPVDTDEVKKLSKEFNQFKETNYIVHVGRFAKVKRHDILIQAFKKADIDAKLILVGDGEEKENIITIIKKLHLEDKVIMTGHVQNPYPLIRDAKLLVLSSEYEGLPTVLIEALTLNTHVVSTNCISGPSEILIDDLSKYLVKVNNIDELSKMIKQVYTLEYNIPSHIINNFELNNIISQYKTIKH
jgi:glycosyltransferase involved in cell wall biosynthesis